MKKIIISIAACIFSLNIMAQNASNENSNVAINNSNDNVMWKYKYCASMKDGKMIVMNEDKELSAEATLTNGIKITTDGYVVKTNGERTALKNGECVDNDGKIIQKSNNKKKAKK
jgi:hypothetical protein